MPSTTPRPRAKHHRTGTLTSTQFQAIRKQLGYEARDLARLLALTEQTIRGIESPAMPQRASRQTEQMLTWLCDPIIRARVEWLEGQKK